MRFICHLVTKYPVSSIYIAFIWVLCFMDVPQTPLNNVNLMDKWVHVLMYAGTCATIWWEYIHRHETLDKKKLFLLAWLAPIIMSGAIELLQAYCTGGRRSGDWLDFAANAIGATLGAVIGMLLARCLAKGNKGK
jgi:VanZ family protein